MPIEFSGSEILVNTTTASDQGRSAIAVLPDGRIVIAWRDLSQTGGDTAFLAVRARILNADGSQSVAEFIVNTTTAGNQSEPAIAVFADGRFVVSWTDSSTTGGDTTGNAVRARVFNADGSEAVPEFLVNSVTTGGQFESDIAILADGRFVVTWLDGSATGADTSGAGVKARIFNPDGSESVAEFLVNTTTLTGQFSSRTAVLSDGRFAVTWSDPSATGGDTSSVAIRARIFNPDGSESVPEFLVNTTTAARQEESKIAVLGDGRIVICWTDDSRTGGDTGFTAIRARILNPDGSESVPEFLVNTTTFAQQREAAIAVLADGRFVITFGDLSGTTNNGAEIRARIFNPDGTQAVPEFIVNTTALNTQQWSDIAVMSDGRFVVTWTDFSATGGDTTGTAVRAQVFDPTIFNGGSGDDVVVGGSLADTHFGNGGSDTLSGMAGNDTLDGGADNDLLFGGLGNDLYIADSQADLVFEDMGAGTDTVESASDFYLYANIENLTLTGGANNFGVGNDLANTLTGNSGENLLIGGLGNDTVHGGAARDAIFGEDGADILNGEAGIDYIVAGSGDDSVNGGDHADEIYGEAGNDDLDGGIGFHTDIMVGGDGQDTLRGASGGGDFDFLYGNLGDDTFYVDTPADLVFEQSGEGSNDTVFANIVGAGYYLYANIETLILEGETPFGVGNSSDNTLIGNAIGNYLLGGAGNDILNGGLGGDVLFGEVGADTFVFGVGTGGDVIGDFAAGTDRIDLSAFFSSFAEAQANFIQNGNVGAINLGNGDLVVLHNVTMNQLAATDFIFG